MFKIILPIMVIAALATSASAQSNTDSTSDAASSASNSLVFEGSSPSASSASVGGAMHTAPCIIGSGVALGVVGGGLSISNGRIETSCLARSEAEWMINLLSMPVGPQRRAATLHACTNVPDMRATLIAVGACARTTQVTQSAAPTPTSPAYTFCGMANGVFTVRVPQGGNVELATAQCQATR
jgi:hypothetical protein